MRKYEIMFIVHPSLDEAQNKELVEKYVNILKEEGSQVLDVKDWGLRELAYEIKKVKKGHYYIINVEASPEAISEFERLSRIDSAIIRHIVVKEEN